MTWEERISTAVQSWRNWNALPTGPRMDRVFKEARVRDLVVESDELRRFVHAYLDGTLSDEQISAAIKARETTQ